jgi:antitoxin component YwqK of YwqJK toxin-antitoxin module
LLEGVSKSYDENGNLQSEAMFKDGQPVSMKQYDGEGR